MAIIYGEKDNGRSGMLSHGEITEMIRRKSNRRASRQNCAACATHMQNIDGLDGGGGITTQYANRTVFHFSRGQRGGNDGCSVFFTLSQAAPGVVTAGIVAVGWHAGADHVYRLDWGKGPPFFTGNRMEILQQHQRGYRNRA